MDLRTASVPIEEIAHHIMVLLVDDQPFVAALLQRALAKETDISFHYCQDPGQAVGTAEKIGPTVILLDLSMPGMDGITVCQFIRAHPATCDIPVVMLSSTDDPLTKAAAFKAGANDYIVKLPDSVELIARLRYHSASYINKLQRDEAYRALRASRINLAESNVQLLKLASFPNMDPNPVIEVNAAGEITYLNPAARRFFPTLVIAQPDPGILGDTSLVRVDSGRQEQVREITVGGIVFEQYLYPVPKSDLVRLYMRDITERKLAEAKLAEQFEELRRFNAIMMDRERRILEVKQEVNELLESIGKPPRYLNTEPDGSPEN